MTDRQKLLLAAIIQEFVDTAEAVGSVSIVDKYDFEISPATVRNEMAELVRQGYLAKTHSSSGRAPTTMGWRFFIQELLEPDDINAEEEATIKEHLFQTRFKKPILIRHALASLSELTGLPAISMIDNSMYFAGMSDLLDHPEFSNIEDLQKVILLFENPELFEQIISHYHGEDGIGVLIGEETKYSGLDNCAIVFSEFSLFRNTRGIISVIGPKRMDYGRVIPSVDFVSHVLNRIVTGW